VFVIEKNYRLQDIQLSKIRLRCFRQLWRGKPQLPTRRSLVPTSFRWLAWPRRFRPTMSGQAPAAKAGGEYRARTGDLLVANQALSQLS
jgi:hypothetical protein